MTKNCRILTGILMMMIVLLMEICIKSSQDNSFVSFLCWIAMEGSSSTTTTTTTTTTNIYVYLIQGSKVYHIFKAQLRHHIISNVLLINQTKDGFASAILIWEVMTMFQVHPRLSTTNGEGYAVLLLFFIWWFHSMIPFQDFIQSFHSNSKIPFNSSSLLLLLLCINWERFGYWINCFF